MVFKMGFLFSRSLGLESAKASLTQAILSEKFPHALLVHGPEGAGQNPLLLDLADILLCEEKSENRPCGKCSSCRGRKANSLDNLIFILPIEKKDKVSAEGDGGVEASQVDEISEKWMEFQQNPYGFSRTEKSRISISQIRDNINRIAYTEGAKKKRIVLIPWAETMDASPANAFLKTLEEPPPNTYFLLSSSDRASLLPTILSRCTQLAIFPMDTKTMLATLKTHGAQLGLETVTPKLLPFADGSLGVLMQLHRSSGEILLEQSRGFWEALLSGDWRNFADFLESSDGFEDLESSGNLLQFLLRMLRVFHHLEIIALSLNAPEKMVKIEDENSGHNSLGKDWIKKALEKGDFDTSLSEYFEPLARAPSLTALKDLCEELLRAIQGYAKPKMAALGLYLEYENKFAKKMTV